MNGNGWGEGRWDTFPSAAAGGDPSVAASGGTTTDDGFDDVFHPSRHEGLLENGQTLVKDPFVFEQEPLANEEKTVDEETKLHESVHHLEYEVHEKTIGVNELKSHHLEEKNMVRISVAGSLSQICTSGFEVVKSKIASKGIGFWTMTSLFGLVGILSYMRKRDKRERELLMILLHEKDQRYIEAILYGIGEYLGSISEEELMKTNFRINQLIQQIALIHEIKSIVKEVAVRKI